MTSAYDGDVIVLGVEVPDDGLMGGQVVMM
jgi:hypothetical protein